MNGSIHQIIMIHLKHYVCAGTIRSASDHNDSIHLKHYVRAGTVRIVQIKVVH